MEALKSLINTCDKPALFFTKANCHYCTKLQASLEVLEVPYEKVTVDDNNRDALIAITDCKPVPQLFIGKEKTFIGGYAEFERLLLRDPQRLQAFVQPYGIELDLPDIKTPAKLETTDDF